MLEKTLTTINDRHLPGKIMYNKFGGLYVTNEGSLTPAIRKIPGKPVEVGIFTNGVFTNRNIIPTLVKQTGKSIDVLTESVNKVKGLLERKCTATLVTYDVEEFPTVTPEALLKLDKDLFTFPYNFTVKSLRYQSRAEANCRDVAYNLLELGLVDDEVDLHFTDDYSYSANFLDYEKGLALDYTVRRLDTKVPFPLITNYFDWLEWVEASVLTRYNKRLEVVSPVNEE